MATGARSESACSGRAIALVTVRRHWIPPAGLLAGFSAHGISWVLLLVLATRGSSASGLQSLAYLHLVALGWLTMIALSILVHVIPTFTEVPWKGEWLARRMLAVYGIGVVALVAAFWNDALWALPWAGTLVALGVFGYVAPALYTLASGFAQARVEAAIARALFVTIGSLLAAVSLGVALGWALAGRLSASLLDSGPLVHASFGVIGWLTVLVMGVSTRTVRPITGARSRLTWVHAAVGVAEIGGLFLGVGGLAFRQPPVAWLGLAFISAGALLYVGDLGDILRRATVSHRVPQAFFWAAAAWLIAGLALAMGALAGRDSAPAALYVLLVGWIGQMVNAHLYHIGIRLMVTMVRGDDDETRPGELLAQPLSWLSFALFQVAVIAGGVGSLRGASPFVAVAACSGLAGWAVMAANIAVARKRAMSGASHISTTSSGRCT